MGLFEHVSYPVAENWERGFYVPSGLTVTEEQRAYVAEQIKFVMANIR